MFFKKRKSRKQLLQEIEELKAMRTEYLDRWMDKCDSYNSTLKQIKKIGAVCIGHEKQDDDVIKNCLCRELAKEIMPYVSYEKYAIASEWGKEFKHTATIKIVTE